MQCIVAYMLQEILGLIREHISFSWNAKHVSKQSFLSRLGSTSSFYFWEYYICFDGAELCLTLQVQPKGKLIWKKESSYVSIFSE